METLALVLGMIYQLKECKTMRRLRAMCIQDVTELEYHKERARTEESIQGLDVLEDTIGIKKYIRGLIRKGKDKKRSYY